LTPLTIHGLVALAGIAAYVIVTVAGHDGNAVLVAALAYGGGAAAQKATELTDTKGTEGGR
jgi:hypothetical protein